MLQINHNKNHDNRYHHSKIHRGGSMLRPATLFILVTISTSLSMAHHGDYRIKKFLSEYQKNPSQKAAELPVKYDGRGRPLPKSSKYFSKDVIENHDFVLLKDEARKGFCQNSKIGQPCRPFWSQGFQGIDRLNEVTDFLEKVPVERNLEKLSVLTQPEAMLESQPWSGDYWATAQGGIAVRTRDPNFPVHESFDKIFNYMNDRHQEDLNDPEVLKRLSPAEKYDLLMGDSEKTLTTTILKNSYRIWEKNGEIESWFGICHGWAPASFMMKEPTQPVSYQIPGLAHPLEFSRMDLKGLASQLWAQGSFRTQMIGGRCNDKTPKLDENGRIESSVCFDVNPASWHFAVLYQLGVLKRSFIMDATYDYQVWNQPVHAYEMVYFHPETKEHSAKWQDAIVPLANLKNDLFAKYRSPRAVSVVGVAMTVVYVGESSAFYEDDSAPQYEHTTSVQYFYDLEIDAQGNVIGGEWYQNAHPDFLWAPASKSGIHSSGEILLNGAWDPKEVPPPQWTRASQVSSQHSQPLSRIVHGLFERSHSPQPKK